MKTDMELTGSQVNDAFYQIVSLLREAGHQPTVQMAAGNMAVAIWTLRQAMSRADFLEFCGSLWDTMGRGAPE